MKNTERIERALEKKALGYDTEEIVEEYVSDGAEVILVRRKVTKKNVPPDVAALKLLMESGGDVREMSDEELEREKARLLAALADKGGKN